NNIVDGSYGLYFSGTTSGLQIHNNNFIDQYYKGMYLYQMNAASVQSNSVTSNTVYTSFHGTEMQYCDNGIQVLKNVIDITIGRYGLYMYYCDGTSGNRGLIGNNFIHMGGSSGTAYGIYTYRCNYENFYYNSINVTRSGTGNRAFYQGYTASGTSNFQIQNNIFSNSGGGYAIYVDYTPSINVSNFNDFYTTGTNLGYWAGNRTNLAAWQTGSSKDANSISVDPEYVSSIDLHTQAYLADDLGFPVAEISDDIDGETRDVITPDMGADEWATPPNDAGVTSINQALTYCITNDSVYVTIKNYGTANLTAVQINWDVNLAGQTPFAWTGNLAQGASEGPFSIGFYNFTLGGQYVISAWTSLPNGGVEGFTHNDQSDLNNIYQAMSGTYTIGGTTPDYASFNAAVVDLVNGGVCGPVVFDVRDGTYNEQISISAVAGTNSTNTVTFQSESGDSSLLILTSTPTSTDNYTVRYNGCDYVTFHQMTIRAIGSTYATAIAIQNSSINCKVTNCELEGSTTTSTSTNLAVIYEGSGTNTNSNFIDNHVVNGSYGIYFSGTTFGLVISDNEFENQYYKGMYLYQMNAVKVHSNLVTSNTAYTSFHGIELQYCDNNIEVLKNQVEIIIGRYGLYMYYCDGTSGNRGLIGNNFIHMGGTSGTAYGIYTYRCNYENFYYNSINVTRSGTGNRAFYQGYTASGTSNFQIQNNIFSNSGGGYAIYVDYTPSINVSNFNDFYATGTNLGYWAGNRTNLAAWQTGSSKDANSISVDPEYVSNFDLHTQGYLTDDLGFPVAEITDDIDGEARDLIAPDMGADEWTTPVDDAGVTAINQALTYCIDNDSVYVTIKNFGTTILTSAQVNWTVNSVLQTPFAWTGSLAQGTSAGSFSVGFYNFTLGGQYDVSAWTSLPNGNVEGLTHNDQSDLNNIYQAMSGTYTIGGSTPDYATFGAAVTDLVDGGVCGPVVFNVRNGTYNEQISISAIAGTNTTNTVTFQSESGDSSLVTLTSTPSSGTNYTVRFNGCDYVSFRELTLRAIGSTYATVLAIQSSSINCSVKNCEVIGSTTTSTSTNLAVIYEGSGTNTGFDIYNNNVQNGSYGIYFSGTTSGIEIINNAVTNQYYKSIYLYQMNAVLVQRNTITSNTAYTSYHALEMRYCDNTIEVLKNKIEVIIGRYGIYMYYCDGTSGNRGIIANNFIHMGGSSGTAYGIYTYRCNYENFYYNSINVTRSGTSNRAFYQGYTASGTSNFQLNNNVFVNTGGGYAIYIDYTSSISVSNFNNFYVTGTNLGYWVGNRINLAAWTAANAKDGNSVSLDPAFVSNFDLHSCAVGLSNAGTPVAGVTVDIDGAPRDLSFPDIGADEFDIALTVDLGADTSACGAFVLDAGNPGASYLWSTGSTNQSITATSTGQYYVDVTNACGVDQDTINVNISATLFVDIGPDTVICAGGNIVLDASNAGATFLWSTTATTQTIVASTSGTYSVNVDNGFCNGDDTVVVTISSPITVTTSGTDENCGGGDGTAFASP
ncbi:MAG: hypothetical protein JKX73_03095, partial [Flavobacteriales bacterium]|nr:hypothetical protein [Flavobacteriales bacterium]